MSRVLARAGLLLGLFALACSSSPDAGSSDADAGAGSGPMIDAPAPKFSELYEAYFAPGTPGHCATVGCHADPGHTVWRCGPAASDCYRGMVDVALIDSATPRTSWLIDERRSPLVWFNLESGNMPFDAQTMRNDAGRDAIKAWVEAGALDD